jgi:hypothetical protein
MEELISAALDTSLATLTTMAPELAPALVALRKAAQQPAITAAERAKTALHDWSVSGP